MCRISLRNELKKELNEILIFINNLKISAIREKIAKEELNFNNFKNKQLEYVSEINAENKKIEELTQSEQNNDPAVAGKCKVCFDKSAHMLLMPCKHLCLCQDCCEQINKKCPICRTEVVQEIAVFIN
jgi:hypothetical protein